MPQGGALSECRLVHYPNAGSNDGVAGILLTVLRYDAVIGDVQKQVTDTDWLSYVHEEKMQQ